MNNLDILLMVILVMAVWQFLESLAKKKQERERTEEKIRKESGEKAAKTYERELVKEVVDDGIRRASVLAPQFSTAVIGWIIIIVILVLIFHLFS